jgi:hypothetical protein
MPKVGKKNYPYTPKGKAAAKKAAKSTANTRTPQTARQRSVVAKRKTASQVRSAPGGRTRAKEPNTLAQIGKALIKMGTAYVNAPKDLATHVAAGVELFGGKTKPRSGSPTSPSAAAALAQRRREAVSAADARSVTRRAPPKPATAKPGASPLFNPPRNAPRTTTSASRRKRKAPTYRG